jgi:tetratricopeptide (TPR) repeat protein
MRLASPRQRPPCATSARALGASLLGVALLVGRAPPALALDSDDARADAVRQIQSVRAELARLVPGVVAAQRRATRSTEKMIASGDLALRANDYEQAIDIFSQVVELYRQGKATPNAHADGLFLLAQAYFESGQLLSARRHYTELLDQAKSAPYDSYAGRSLARLVDVAVQTNRLDTLDAIAARVDALPAADPTGSFEYARGKLSLARGRFDEALSILGAVAAESPYFHQARYVMGTVLAKRALSEAGLGPSAEAQARLVTPGAAARLAPAIAQFHEVTRLSRDSPQHAQVVDLSWLAIGRLNYEVENYLDASQAYIQVGRQSTVYYEMLYELAWVYVRVGDYARAERALELLAVAAPDTLDIADGALLRADLMLRSGRFDRALASYEDVRTRFEPARERVDQFLASTADPAVYYDRLIEDGLSLGGPSALPDVVLDWVREEARGERVFALIDDVTHAREVLRRSRRLSSKLNAILATPSRARAFPELEVALKEAIGLDNQLTRARRSIALGLDDSSDAAFSGKLGEARQRRRALMQRVLAAPVTPADFLRREEQGERAWSRVSQAVQRATLETDKLQAVINGLRQVLDQGEKHGVTRNPASRAQFRAEVEARERELGAYRARIDEYRQQVENGRVQVGLGDRRFEDDIQARRRFRQALSEEVGMLAAGYGDDDSLDDARAAAPMLEDIAVLEQRVEEVIAMLEAEVSLGSEQIRHQVAEEAERIREYSAELDALDQYARVLVGEVAMKNFANVRARLKNIVLRADVGIVQQAWELREEQQARLRGLQRQRALEEQNLQDELREVSDDMGDGP